MFSPGPAHSQHLSPTFPFPSPILKASPSIHQSQFSSAIDMKSQSPAPAPKPSPPSYPSYDCSQLICSPYCLQWCPASTDYPTDTSSSSSTLSPLLIALITALSVALLLLLYYTFSSRLCKPRRPNPSRNVDAVEEERRLHAHLDQLALQDMLGPSVQIQPWTPAPVTVRNSDGGLNDRFIQSITVFKYRREDGLVESTDCAVCLTEFKEEENLRLMPNCQHAFHPPCIDTWLRSHSNCPICRALMVGAPAPAPAPSAAGVSRMRVQSGGDVVVMVDAGVQVSVVGEIVSDGRDLDRRRQVATEGEVVEGEKEKATPGC